MSTPIELPVSSTHRAFQAAQAQQPCPHPSLFRSNSTFQSAAGSKPCEAREPDKRRRTMATTMAATPQQLATAPSARVRPETGISSVASHFSPIPRCRLNSGVPRRRRPVLLSWKMSALPSSLSLLLPSPIIRNSSATSGPDRITRCATTEDVEAEKELIEEDAMERMDKTLESVKGNFNTVRTGRASPSLLDRVEVEYYGTQVILKSIAQVSTPDGSTILVAPFDKSSLPSIEKALVKSDVGITPSSDGNVIRLNVPQLTADRRKELLKLVSKLTEDGKVAVRNVRRDAIKAFDKLEKDKKLSGDNVKDATDDIQKLTDDYVKKIDTLLKQKEKELSSV